MSSSGTLAVSERASGVAQITMARPAVFNAFDQVSIGEVDAAFAQFGDAGVRGSGEAREAFVAFPGKCPSAWTPR